MTLRNGVTADELKEILLQTMIYCGVPAANTAFGVAVRVLAEAGGQELGPPSFGQPVLAADP